MSNLNYAEIFTQFLDLTRAEYTKNNNPAFSDEAVFRACLNGCQQLDPQAKDMLIELNLLEDDILVPAFVATMPEILAQMGILDLTPYQCDQPTCPKKLAHTTPPQSETYPLGEGARVSGRPVTTATILKGFGEEITQYD